VLQKSKGKGKASDADASAARAAKKQRRIEKQAKAVMEDDRFAHIMSDKRFKVGGWVGAWVLGVDRTVIDQRPERLSYFYIPYSLVVLLASWLIVDSPPPPS
jgi:hypothetical protein